MEGHLFNQINPLVEKAWDPRLCKTVIWIKPQVDNRPQGISSKREISQFFTSFFLPFLPLTIIFAHRAPKSHRLPRLKLIKDLLSDRCWLDYSHVLMWSYVCPAAGFTLVSHSRDRCTHCGSCFVILEGDLAQRRREETQLHYNPLRVTSI